MIIHRSFSGAALKNLSELNVNLMGKEADCEISPSPPLTCSFKKSGCQSNRELKNESDCCRPVSLRVRRHSPSNTKNNDFSRQYYSNGNENIPYTHSQCVDQVVSPVLCSVNDKQISTRNKETSKRQIRDPLKEIYSECAFPFSIFSDKNSKLPRPLKSPKNSNLNKNCSIIPKSQQKQAKKSTKFGNRKRNKPYLKLESTNSNLQFTTLKESFNKSYKNKKCSNTEEVSLLFEFPKKTTVNKIESNVKMSSLQCSTKHELKISNNPDQNSTCLLKRKQPFQFLESGLKKSKTQLSSSENNNITSKTCLSDLNRCFDNNYSEDFIILESLDEFEPLDSSQIHSPILGSTTSECVSNAKYDETCVSPILGSAFRNSENPLKQDLKKVVSSDGPLKQDLKKKMSFSDQRLVQVVSSDGELVIGDTNHHGVEVHTRNKDIDFANENLVPQDMTFNHFRESISCCKQYSHSKEFMPKYINSLVQVVSSPPEDSDQCTNVHLLDNANSMINKSVHKLENINLKHINLPIIEEPLSPVLGDCMNKKYCFPEKEDSNKTNVRLFSGNSYELKNKRFSSINDLVAVPNSSYENSFEKYVEYYSFGAQVNNEPMSPVLSSKIPKLETAEKKCERNIVVNERSNFPSESNSVKEPIFTLNVNDAKKPNCFGNLKSTSHKDSVSCLQTKSTPDTNRKHKTLKNKLHLTPPSATALLSTMPEKTNLSATKTLLCKNWEDEPKVSDLSSRITLSPVFDLNLKVGSIVSGLKEDKKLSPGPMFPIQMNQKTKKPNFKCSIDLSIENSVLNVDLFDENNSNSEKIISPSTDSELDIIKYPIHFSHVELPLSPLLAADAKILFASMVESTEKNKSLSCTSKNNYKRKSSVDKIFDTSLSGKVVGQLMSQERKEVVSGVNGKLHEEESIDKCKSPAICNLVGSAKRTIVVESTANLESTDCQSHKKTVKKRLSFENTQFKNQSSSVVTNKKKLNVPKISEDDDIILSGIEKLPGVLPEQLEIVKENHIDFLKPNSKTSEEWTRADCSLETEKKKYFNKVQNKLLLWKDFERNDDIMIEEFPEDYSSDNCFENSGKISTLETVKRNFNEEFTQCVTSSKEYFMVPCEDMLSEVSDCKDEIQEALSQESLKSPDFNIECSSSPIKSSKETQNERSSGVLSFPPPLDVAANRTCNNTVLDSACKSKRTRMKTGSLVERLRRLVRAERAAVNMFHYEGAPGVAARAGSLLVRCVMTTCSKLFIIGHYVNKYQTVSDELSLGEEDMNPEVWLFTDPSYVRNITPGSIVMVYPPWQNVWQNGRGIMLIFGATKIRQVNSGRLPVLPSSLTVATLEQHYRCQSQQDQCCCRGTLMSQLFRVPVMEQGQCESHSWTQGSVMAALTGGCYPHPVQLSVTVLHRFHYRSHNKRSTASLLCVDGNGHICQINLVNMDDESKLEPLLMESSTKTLEFSQVVICKRVNIDRCQGLRSMLSQLHAESASQLLMYVATPLSDQWSAHTSPTFTVQPRPLADISQGDVGRARARVCVMALRADHLYVWDKQLDSYYKINILSSAEVPKFPARAVLAIDYICVQQDELTIDKFSTITVLGNEAQDSPTSIPSLSLQSLEGDLVLLDSVVTRVNSDVRLRWEGDCGHKLLRLQRTSLFYCVSCSQTVTTSHQRLGLDVCVVASDLSAPIRVKVKSETAQVFLLGSTGEVSSEKSYNMIGVIGMSLKCLALVLEVLRNPFGDVLEFLLEEL